MKKYLPFVLLAAFSSFASCTENEEPVSPLLGNWEHREYVDSLDVWIIETMEVKNDSIFDLKVTVRDTETGPTLGYQMITTAWYDLAGETFRYYYADGLYYFGSIDDIEDPILYVPKEELTPGIVDFFRIPEGVLTFSEDRRSFQFQPDCLIINTENDCIQFPLKEYIRVN